jgi:hypothetical protein
MRSPGGLEAPGRHTFVMDPETERLISLPQVSLKILGISHRELPAG